MAKIERIELIHGFLGNGPQLRWQNPFGRVAVRQFLVVVLALHLVAENEHQTAAGMKILPKHLGLVAAEAAEGRIEATDTTQWWGFKDDVVIRILPGRDQTSVDVRSKSRIGRGDMGANARRVRDYLATLQSRLAR